MHSIRLPALSECMVFFDFDNTITRFDVLDAIIEKFSVNQDWVAVEAAWKRGEIGSMECLTRQLELVRVSKKDLLRYLSGIEIDPFFHKFYAILNKEKIKPVILSDSFTFIIDSVLENNGLRGLRIYANNLKFSRDRLIPSFPHRNKRCLRCAHCKKKNLIKKEVRDKITIYIGDGLSDACPAEHSDLVFAKARLLEHFRQKDKFCLEFNNLEDIYNYLGGRKNDPEAKDIKKTFKKRSR